MKHVLMYMAVIAMLLSSCTSGSADKATTENLERAVLQDKQLSIEQSASTRDFVSADTTASAAKPVASKTPTYQYWDKKIIKTANISLELTNYAAYNQKLHTGLKAYGAYIASEEQSQDDYRIINHISIKVPVEQFENLINSFSGDGNKLLSKKISSEDVTGEVVDTKSRIEAKKQVREKYLQLLRQARNMKEILEVQSEINAIQENLETAAGRVNYLTHQSSYSTIHLEYFQYLNGVSQKPESGFLIDLKKSFSGGINAIGQLVLLVVAFWPLLIVLTAILIWLRKKKLNRRAIAVRSEA